VRAAARSQTGDARLAWLICAAVSIGGGAIWSMHFIGMLAYQTNVSYSFGVPYTLVSLVVAVLASGIGIYLVSRGTPTASRLIGAGTIAGLGVAGMHYLGMEAMRANADVSWRASVVVISVVIAVVATSLALFFAFTITKLWAMLAAAVLMGIGICGMHYTGMVAMVVHTRPNAVVASTGVDPLSLALPVFGISSVLLFILLFVGLFDDSDRVPVVREPALSAAR
jgi:NO-binding membrane sensor protein with MHYT domain